MIKGIIFDLDGVLIDSELHYLKRKIQFLAHYGIEWKPEMAYTYVGHRFSLQIPEIFPEKSEEELKDVMTYYWSVMHDPMDYNSIRMEGSDEVLRELKTRGYRLAIGSLSTREKIDTVIRQNHWEDLFDATVSFNEVTKRKPDPEVYLKAMELLGLKPEECVVVEDSRVGIDAALASKACCVVRRENRYLCDQSGADIYIDSLWDLPKVIK